MERLTVNLHVRADSEPRLEIFGNFVAVSIGDATLFFSQGTLPALLRLAAVVGQAEAALRDLDASAEEVADAS